MCKCRGDNHLARENLQRNTLQLTRMLVVASITSSFLSSYICTYFPRSPFYLFIFLFFFSNTSREAVMFPTNRFPRMKPTISSVSQKTGKRNTRIRLWGQPRWLSPLRYVEPRRSFRCWPVAISAMTKNRDGGGFAGNHGNSDREMFRSFGRVTVTRFETR